MERADTLSSEPGQIEPGSRVGTIIFFLDIISRERSWNDDYENWKFLFASGGLVKILRFCESFKEGDKDCALSEITSCAYMRTGRWVLIPAVGWKFRISLISR